MKHALSFAMVFVTLTSLSSAVQQPLPSAPPRFVDSFAGNALDPSWSVLNPSLATISVSGGALHIAPNQGGLGTIWFQDAEGALVYRTVTGDFTATARVHARRTSNGTLAPDVSYRLGGILARRPGSSPGARDSVHVALGAGVLDAPPFAALCAEDKTTDDSVSDFLLHPIASADGELRLRRRGASFQCAYRAQPNAPWSVLRTHTRADLPPTLQLGLMAYSASSPPDLVVHFERFVLEP